VIRLSSITTWVEGVVGLVLCVVYLFLYVCAIEVPSITEDVESNSTDVNQVMHGIYSYYIASGDCVYQDGQNATTNNPNPLTKPNIIFIIQTLYLVLNIMWLFSSTLLFKATRNRGFYLSPWLACVACLTILDIVAAILIFTDLAVDRENDFDDSSDDLPWMVATMVMYFTRGGVGLIYNVVVFIFVLRLMINKGQPEEHTTPYWTDKGFDDIRREISRRGHHNENDHTDHTTLYREETANSGKVNGFNGYTNNGFLNGDIPDYKEDDYHEDEGVGHQGGPYTGSQDRSGVYTGGQDRGGVNTGGQDRGGTQQTPYIGGHDRGGALQSPYTGGPVRGPRHDAPDDAQARAEENIYERPASFKDRVREAKENKTNVGVGGMFRYSMDTAHLRQKALKPRQDVDTPFNFLSKYDDTGSQRSISSIATSHQMPGHRGLTDDKYFNIPRVKVPIARSASLLRSQENAKHQMKDYVTTYFVPLKE